MNSPVDFKYTGTSGTSGTSGVGGSGTSGSGTSGTSGSSGMDGTSGTSGSGGGSSTFPPLQTLLIPKEGYLFPLVTTRAYFEKILYSPTAIFKDGVALRKYVAYYGNGTNNFVAYSDNGITWDTETIITNVLPGYHSEVIVIGTILHLFYWNHLTSVYSAAAIRHATIDITVNCSIATTDAPLTGTYIYGASGGGNIRAGTYGVDKAFYNAAPTNNVLNPYSYAWCIIHNGTDGVQESALFATSSDGYNFAPWNGLIEVIPRGVSPAWDRWIGNVYIWKVGIDWFAYYGGGLGTGSGADTNFGDGLGFATSSDGITWTKYAKNPIISKTYSYKSAKRLYCPCIVNQDDGWILYYTVKGQDSKYQICKALVGFPALQ